jgi:putative GTP pyrophosphokinase
MIKIDCHFSEKIIVLIHFMEFKKPPNLSRTAIRKAGDILISNTDDVSKIENARLILNQWRACHTYPINTFQATLRRKATNGLLGEGAIVAQRLKRSSTILSKLRELNVGLPNMQDIAGVRAILLSINDVYRLKVDYENPKRFKHKLWRINDYIQDPKSDGYRSVHLIYKYKNKDFPYWDDLLIELQLR